jgi:hypothetical protein
MRISGATDRETATRFALRASAVLAVVLTCFGAPGFAQAPPPVTFQVVWVVVGELATADNRHPVRVGRQLFRGSDLMDMTLHDVKIARVDADPAVMQIAVGQQVCLSGLKVRAFDAKGKVVAAPLSVAVRQDHKERLQLQRSKNDICVRPADPGEYPIRLTSLLPATDGTMRGAQLFLRAASPLPAYGQGADPSAAR